MAEVGGVWGKLGGAGLGLAVGGPLGALIGLLAGHLLVDRVGAPFGPTPKDLVFTTGLVALAAKMAKSDGVVVDSEVAAFERIVRVPEGERPKLRRLFDLAKGTEAGFEGYARQIADAFADEPALREDVLDGLFHVAAADGVVHESEAAYLRRVAEIFGFGEADFARIAARHARLPDDPYLVIGADRGWSDAALVRHRRALVAEHHPDRALAHGLPPEAVAIATRRLAAINDAWGRIAAERGFVSLAPESPLAARVAPSPNHDARVDAAGAPARPGILILHYTGMATGAEALARLRDPIAKVSAHYLVHEDGAVVQMVPEGRRAWHAGAGAWAGERDLNSRSLGVEIVNAGHAGGLPPYPDGQVEAVIALSRDLLARWGIRPERVLAHSDIAPERKEDPGERFPWDRLAAAGVGHWVQPAPPGDGRFLSPGEEGRPVEALQAMLALYGYDCPVSGRYDPRTAAVVTAFQRHFRQARVDGIADASTITTLRDLLAALPSAEA